MAKKRKSINPLVFIILAFVLLALILNFVQSSKPRLTELQVLACNVADASNTCGSRLSEVGIVLKEECCSALGKCCS